jgi:hypothetical protein
MEASFVVLLKIGRALIMHHSFGKKRKVEQEKGPGVLHCHRTWVCKGGAHPDQGFSSCVQPGLKDSYKSGPWDQVSSPFKENRGKIESRFKGP